MARMAGIESTAKNNVCGFNDQKHDCQRRGEIISILLHEELIPFIIIQDRYESSEEAKDWIPFRTEFFLFLEGHFDADEDQEEPKDIDDPVKSLNQCDPGNDEDGSQDNGTKNSPEEDLMLIEGRDFKVGEDEQEDKDIVHAEGLFDQVTGQKLKRFLGAIPEVNPNIE